MLKKFILELFFFDSLNLSFSVDTTLNFSVLLLFLELTIFQVILIESEEGLEFLLLANDSAVSLFSVIASLNDLAKGSQSFLSFFDIIHQDLIDILIRCGSVIYYFLFHSLLENELELLLLLR